MAKYNIIPSSRTIVQSPISIGHKAEKGVEAIEFDLTAWVETYGSGTLTVVMQRWGDAIPYPIALEIDENNKATWTLSDTDTAKAGMAYAQLSYIVGDEVVKKSDIYTFRVMDSLVGEGEPPEAYDSWLEQLTHLAAEAMAEVLDIEGIVTDKTLTVDGGIADAKATGDALGALEDQFTEETDKLKADLGDVTGNVRLPITGTKAYINLAVPIGRTINVETPISSLTAKYLIAACLPGDQFVVTTVGGSGGLAYGFLSSTYALISKAAVDVTLNKALITAPENAAYIVVNSVKSNDLVVYRNRLLVDRVDDLKTGILNHTGVIVTKANYLTYFPNGSFNDAKPNTIYGITEFLDTDEDPVIADAPTGDQVYGLPVNQAQTPTSPVKSTGAIRGTLLTFSQAYGENDATGLAQIFVSYPGYLNYYNSTSPSICYRIAYRSNNEYHWSEWSKISQRGVVHSGNGVVYGGEPYISKAPFTDLNDAPWNGIYHIDRNMDGSDEAHTLGHHPIPGQSCMVITYAFSPAFNHCRVQVVHALNGRMFWRYEYLDEGQKWTGWYEILNNKSSIRSGERLANGTDLNTVKTNSVYLLGGQSAAQYVNNPITSGAGFLSTKWYDTTGLQVVEALSGSRYSRYTSDNGATWSNWV